MSSDELSLMWDDHHNTLVKVFGKLLKTSRLVDCTIAAEGQYIKAHKIILSACSPYFELLFNQENEKNPIVVLKDVKFQELKAIIDFVYSGKVRVPEDRLGDFVDAAESLQIKGLGSDNYNTPSSGRISEKSESPHPPKPEFSDSSSPVRRKRRRPSSINEDNVNEIPSGTNLNYEYQSIESVPQSQMQVDRLSHQIGQHSSIASALNSLCSASVSVHSIQRIVETDSPASFAEQPTPPPPLEMLPNPDAMVIKTEPEPIEEVCLPEMDFEPKSEEDVEDTIVLDSDDEVSGAVLNVDSQSSSNQYSAFSTALQTAAASSDNAFLMTDVAEHTSTQGAVGTYARGGSCLPPPTRMHQADLTFGDVLASAFRASAAVSVAAAVTTAPPVPEEGTSSRIESQRPRRRHSCHVCGKIFPSSSQLARHLRTHSGDRPFKCEQCGKAFTQMATLKCHKLTRTGDSPFNCEQCGKAFTRVSHLKIHQRTHTGDRPFKCEPCGKAFSQMGNLQKHQRTHTGDRPFSCEQCNKVFSQMSHLQEHLHTHTGERPYRCDECGVTKRHKSNLYHHMRRVHGVLPTKRRGLERVKDN